MRPSTRALIACGAFFCLSVAAGAQRNPIASLKGVTVPQPAGWPQYVANQQALIVLGKALFWDAQVGSDGRTACASCHFHAGADHRITNEIAPPAALTTAVRPNTTLTIGDFPFHAFTNPSDNGSALIRDRRDVVGSAGIVRRTFVDITEGDVRDVGADGDPGVFSLGGLKVRQVTSRNAPTVINAVFNLRNFWDGRASNIFNAATPFGIADRRANVLVVGAGELLPAIVRLDASSLARCARE